MKCTVYTKIVINFFPFSCTLDEQQQQEKKMYELGIKVNKAGSMAQRNDRQKENHRSDLKREYNEYIREIWIH